MVGAPPLILPFPFMVSLGYITHGLLTDTLFVGGSGFQHIR